MDSSMEGQTGAREPSEAMPTSATSEESLTEDISLTPSPVYSGLMVVAQKPEMSLPIKPPQDGKWYSKTNC